MPTVPAEVRDRVRRRAQSCREHCRLSQVANPFLRFQVEHVVARQHGGETVDANLACAHCNRHKGPNLAGLDPQPGQLTPLYHPRRQPWGDHFEFVGPVVVGRTDAGRTTVRLLNVNAPRRAELRSVGGQLWRPSP